MTVTWGKTVLSDVAIDAATESVDDFRAKLFSLTGVPPERQKIMGFKGGALKPGASWAQLGLKAGLKLMLIGTAGERRARHGFGDMRACPSCPLG